MTDQPEANPAMPSPSATDDTGLVKKLRKAAAAFENGVGPAMQVTIDEASCILAVERFRAAADTIEGFQKWMINQLIANCDMQSKLKEADSTIADIKAERDKWKAGQLANQETVMRLARYNYNLQDRLDRVEAAAHGLLVKLPFHKGTENERGALLIAMSKYVPASPAPSPSTGEGK